MSKSEDWLDNLKELVSGGYIMLFIFGGTVCFLASASLIIIAFAHSPEKIALFKEIIIALIGFISGAYTTMWNNQHFKEQKNGYNGIKTQPENTDKKGG